VLGVGGVVDDDPTAALTPWWLHVNVVCIGMSKNK
jgi:hypothetical protein